MPKRRGDPQRVRPDRHILYFDSNIYSSIARHGSLQAVRRFLRGRDLQVLGSLFNLFEAFRIEDPDKQAVQVKTIGRLAWTFLEESQTYREAVELLNEIRRHRAGWLSQSPDLRPTKFYRRAAANHWLA